MCGCRKIYANRFAFRELFHLDALATTKDNGLVARCAHRGNSVRYNVKAGKQSLYRSRAREAQAAFGIHSSFVRGVDKKLFH